MIFAKPPNKLKCMVYLYRYTYLSKLKQTEILFFLFQIVTLLSQHFYIFLTQKLQELDMGVKTVPW